ncbi:hypothetical protein [Citrobacter portucalensis]|nr:hypothetical protein [Citrobacter portucalensis]WNI84134.1 hypothetical protein RIK60_00350 [Citrobacter portucalensis]
MNFTESNYSSSNDPYIDKLVDEAERFLPVQLIDEIVGEIKGEQ